MRATLRRIWRSNVTFAAALALLFGAILRSVAEDQSPAEAMLWLLVLLGGALLTLEGLARAHPEAQGRVVSGETLEEIRRAGR